MRGGIPCGRAMSSHVTKTMKNLRMLAISAYNIYASAAWNLAWKWLPYNQRLARYGTGTWSKARSKTADWCADFVYNGSGWHGLYARLDGREVVIRVEFVENVENPCEKSL